MDPVAIVCVEQLYPFPSAELARVLARYPAVASTRKRGARDLLTASH